MLDQGNGQLSAVGFFNPTIGQRPVGEFFGGAPAGGAPAGEGPLPYEVRWDDSLNEGSGGYKIYLPAAEGLLSFWGDEVATSTFTGVGSLGADTRWFSLDDVSANAQDVWLVITVGFSNGAFDSVSSAGFSDARGTASTGTIVRNVRVAELFSAGHVVRQALVGALHIGHKLVAGDDTNLQFAPSANGEDVKVDVYYA